MSAATKQPADNPTSELPPVSRAESIALAPHIRGNAGALLHRLVKFAEELRMRRGGNMSLRDLQRFSFLSEDLTVDETKQAVIALAMAYADALEAQE